MQVSHSHHDVPVLLLHMASRYLSNTCLRPFWSMCMDGEVCGSTRQSFMCSDGMPNQRWCICPTLSTHQPGPEPFCCSKQTDSMIYLSDTS